MWRYKCLVSPHGDSDVPRISSRLSRGSAALGRYDCHLVDAIIGSTVFGENHA